MKDHFDRIVCMDIFQQAISDGDIIFLPFESPEKSVEYDERIPVIFVLIFFICCMMNPVMGRRIQYVFQIRDFSDHLCMLKECEQEPDIFNGEYH